MPFFSWNPDGQVDDALGNCRSFYDLQFLYILERNWGWNVTRLRTFLGSPLMSLDPTEDSYFQHFRFSTIYLIYKTSTFRYQFSLLLRLSFLLLLPHRLPPQKPTTERKQRSINRHPRKQHPKIQTNL